MVFLTPHRSHLQYLKALWRNICSRLHLSKQNLLFMLLWFFPPPAPPQRHPMTTRSRDGTQKQRTVLNLNTSTVSLIPTSHLKALKDPNWNSSMTVEYDALIKNKIFNLVCRPPDANIVRSMWLYKHKLDADGHVRRHKSWLVANEKSQEHGLGYDKHLVMLWNRLLYARYFILLCWDRGRFIN